MPVIQLPADLLKHLKISFLWSALEWDTHAPPPPISELVELPGSTNKLLARQPVDGENIAIIAPLIIAAWTSIVTSAHLRNGLSDGQLGDNVPEISDAGRGISNDIPEGATSGMGSGVSNLPAWMTSSSQPSKPSGDDPSVVSEVAVAEARSILAYILSKSSSVQGTDIRGHEESRSSGSTSDTVMNEAPDTSQDAENGSYGITKEPRGVCNLPVWMTNPELTKRIRSSSGAEAQASAKRPRSAMVLSSTFQYLLKLKIDPQRRESMESKILELAKF